MEKLSLVLWRERELLEQLQYRLEVEQLVMSSGRSRWLAAAAREVEEVLDQVRATEILRAAAADEVAESLGLAPNPSLGDLIENAEEPYRSILAEHRDAFVAVSEEISRVAEANRSLITSGLRSARETLLGLGGGMQTYTPAGTTVTESPRVALVDRSL